MEQKISMEWTERGVVLTLKGELDQIDLGRLAHINHDDERSVVAKYVVADLSQATSGKLQPRDIDYVAAIDIGASRSNPGMKLALVATTESAVAACRYYMDLSQRLGTTWDIRLFDTLQEAKSWCEP